MDFFVHLIGVVDALNVLVAKVTLLMWEIDFCFKAAKAATDAFWRFRGSLRKHKKSRSKNDR